MQNYPACKVLKHKGNEYIFRGRLSNSFGIPSEKGSTLRGKTPWEKILSFKNSPFSEGSLCARKETGSHEIFSLNKMAENHHLYPFI